MNIIDQTFYQSPLGQIAIYTTQKGICKVGFVADETPPSLHDSPTDLHPHLAACVAQLAEYFDKKRTDFDLPLDMYGTDFQQQVWAELLKIPYGDTTTYGNIANDLQQPKGARAVGSSCGRNKIWLIVPCHRVVGRTGSLTGYAGGVARKSWLLRHENAKGVVINQQQRLF